MAQENGMAANYKMLHRPRLHRLIQNGLAGPLLVMLAGPGYGKTQAMVDYAGKIDADVLWLRLGALDNLPSHFWGHLQDAMKRKYQAAAGGLGELEFPAGLPGFEVFAQLVRGDILAGGRAIWVFDDYGEIDSQQVKGFVRMLVEANIEGLSIVLMSNALDSTESVAFMTNKRTLLLADDLRFTREEIQALYQLYGIVLEPDELAAVERYTQGWPLALHLLALQHDQLPDLLHQNERMTFQVISHLFEERFFSTCLPAQQKLLLKLSLLDSFTMELAVRLYGGNADEADLFLGSHAFLINEPSTGRLFLHHLYRLFLQQKQHLLQAEERSAAWRAAAEYYAAAGSYIDAVGYYRQCGNHIGMLTAIGDYIRLQQGIQMHGITPENAEFFLEHLDLLTPKESAENPVADYYRAVVYLNTLELDRAEALFTELERRLLADGTPPAMELLGDTYAMLGSLHMMRNQEDFGDYYKKADVLLPNGTVLQNRRGLRVHNNHSFSIQDNAPGAKERMEQAVHYGVHLASKVLRGGLSGMEHVFSAEAAYLSLQLDKARQHAYRAIYAGKAHAQHDVVCNAHFLLARIGLLEGNFAEMRQQVRNVEAYAGEYSIGALKEIRDTALGWYYIRLHDNQRVPKSIQVPAAANRPLLTLGRLDIIYTEYLINTGEYARLVGMLEYPVGLYLTGGIWYDRISLHILLAIGYYHLGNRDAALKTLWNAYDITHNNELITPFIETEGRIRELVALARQQREYAFSAEWLDLVDRQAAAYTRRAEAVRAEYRRQNPQKTAKDNPLTRREQAVLQAVARGLTREEIAIEQHISVNTVKSTISHVYNKLGASNKADAVSIAIKREYIEAYAPE